MNHATDTSRQNPQGEARPRVLHVVDLPGAGWDALAAAARCAQSLPADQRLLLIGDRCAAADAAAFGLRPDYRLCPPLNRLAASVGPLDRLIKGVSRVWPIDVVHVWSDSARVLCRQTLGFHFPLIQEDPALFAPPLLPQDRASVRSSLGIAPHETALLLASDRPGVGDTRRFTGLVSLLAFAELAVVGIAGSRGDSFRRAARFMRGFNRYWDVIPIRTPPHTALAAADIVIYDQGDSLTADAGPGPRTGGIVLTAGAMGIPVVTTDSPLARRLVGPLAQRALAVGGGLPDLATRTLPLATDASIRAQAGRDLHNHTATLPAPGLMERWVTACSQGAAA
ncbi:MAG: hypothetical protein Q8L55_06450 [Phycisphaerales bacterium]|nr:hypothetical protein [Phycisphaerales bacterium]